MKRPQRILLLWAIVTGGLVAAAVATASPPADEQVSAAIDRAVRQLYDQIARTPIDSHISTGEFLQRTRGQDELLDTLRRAQQIGGPRWIDDHTCQVQLEISGARVARTLSQIAASQPQRSPIAPDVLELRLADWRSRTFSTTGSSTSAARVEQIVPADAAQGPWRTVGEDARRQAIGDAKYDAVLNVFDSIAPIPLAGGKTIGDALEIDAVADHMHQWFARRPATNLEFRDDLQVEITLSAPADEVSNVLREALGKQSQIPMPSDEQWATIASQIRDAIAPAVGHGRVERRDSAVQTTQAQADWMAGSSRDGAQAVENAPQWIDQRLTAQGSAPREKSKLRSARAAEADAIRKLDAQVRGLPLDADTTIAQAAQQNGRVEDAVQRALRSARVLATDYARPDETVAVTVELDLQTLWEELLRGP